MKTLLRDLARDPVLVPFAVILAIAALATLVALWVLP